MIEKSTFGNFRSAEIVTEILQNRSRRTSKKVSSLLHRYFSGLKGIEKIKNDRVKEDMAILWKNTFLNRVNFDNELDDFIKAIIITKYKIIIRKES